MSIKYFQNWVCIDVGDYANYMAIIEHPIDGYRCHVQVIVDEEVNICISDDPDIELNFDISEYHMADCVTDLFEQKIIEYFERIK